MEKRSRKEKRREDHRERMNLASLENRHHMRMTCVGAKNALEREEGGRETRVWSALLPLTNFASSLDTRLSLLMNSSNAFFSDFCMI